MTESFAIALPQGGELPALIAYPPGNGAVPLLIIAPGSAYPKEGGLITALARHAVAAGWAALRFDWRYTAAGGRPSGNREREAADLEGVLAYARELPRVAAQPIVLAGKSLGAAVAYRVFRSHPGLAAALLLTPVFRDAASGDKHYPGLKAEQRPVQMLTGNRDALNSFPAMEAYVRAATGGQVTVTVVEGDHGLQVSRKKDAASQAANATNIEGAVAKVVGWLEGLI